MRLILLAAMIVCAGRAQESEPGRMQFESRCAGCHGADGGGGEHAPSIVEVGRRGSGVASERKLRETISNGIPEGGMPAFSLAAAEMNSLVSFITALRAPAADHPAPGDPERGKLFFLGAGNCVKCHMLNGRGGILGPDLSNLGRERRLSQIAVALRNPEALQTPGYRPVKVRLRDGRTLEGWAWRKTRATSICNCRT